VCAFAETSMFSIIQPCEICVSIVVPSENARHFARYGFCSMRGMATAQRLEDLVVWQLAVELRDGIIRLTETGRVATDFEFRDQIRDSSGSAARNVAEGFGRFLPRAFANHVRIARGSLTETANHLKDGRTRRYFSEAQTDRLLKLTARASIAATRLLKYLDSCRGEAPTGWGKTGSVGSKGSKKLRVKPVAGPPEPAEPPELEPREPTEPLEPPEPT
jgi:four helix bundle protein